MRKFDKIYQERMKMYGVVVEQNQLNQNQQQNGGNATQSAPNGTTQAAPNGTAQSAPNGTSTATGNATQAAPNGTAQAAPNGTTQAAPNGTPTATGNATQAAPNVGGNGTSVNLDQKIADVSNNPSAQTEIKNIQLALSGKYPFENLEPAGQQLYNLAQRYPNDPRIQKIFNSVSPQQ